MNSKRQCALRSCRTYFPPADGIVSGVNAWCSDDHKIAWAIEAGRKLMAQRAKNEKREHDHKKRAFQERDYPYQFNLTKKAAQKLANALDSGRRCISCDCERNVQFCGGHFRTVGAHRELALDLRNIHGQCNRNCNMGLSGNIGGTKKSRGFRSGLLDRYGQTFVDFLESAHPQEKRTCSELIAMRKEFSAEIRRLEKGLPPSKDWRELPQQQQRAA